jgi:hypothetical protein
MLYKLRPGYPDSFSIRIPITKKAVHIWWGTFRPQSRPVARFLGPGFSLPFGRDVKGTGVAQVGVVSRKGGTASPSTTLRSGRDDNSVVAGIDATEQCPTLQQNCHPDRSEPGFPTTRC